MWYFVNQNKFLDFEYRQGYQNSIKYALSSFRYSESELLKFACFVSPYNTQQSSSSVLFHGINCPDFVRGLFSKLNCSHAISDFKVKRVLYILTCFFYDDTRFQKSRFVYLELKSRFCAFLHWKIWNLWLKSNKIILGCQVEPRERNEIVVKRETNLVLWLCDLLKIFRLGITIGECNLLFVVCVG